MIEPMTVFPPSTTEPCSIHLEHRPLPLDTVELHHVVPQAWQLFWWPGKSGRRDHAAPHLWHPQTVPLCPTGHRNVHHMITAIMHNFERFWDEARDEEPVLVSAWKAIDGNWKRRAEYDVALEAAETFLEAGGSLFELTANGLWGQA